MREPYSPTPQQIREACRKIQTQWSEAERRSRAVGYGERDQAAKRWLPPFVKAEDMPREGNH